MDTNKNLPWFLTHDNPERLYREGSYLVLDFETDTLDHGSALNEDNDVVLACWQIVLPDGRTVKTGSQFGGIYEMDELLDDISRVDFIVAQNLKFELQWLKRCGLELRNVLGYDTLLGQWVLDGNRREPRSLAALARKYGVFGKLDAVAALIRSGVAVRDIHPAWLLDYCHADVEATKLVFQAQQDLLSAQQQWHLVHTRNLCCSVLADIEFEGLTLDPKLVHAEYLRAVQVKESLGKRLAKLTKGINLNSPKQMAAFVYGTLGIPEATDYKGKPLRTPKDEQSANAKVMALLKPRTRKQKYFLYLYKAYNRAVSLLEKNLDYFKLTCEQRGGKFYGEFRQAQTQTHRLASSGIPILFNGLKKTKSVQLQNIPREYKQLFCSGDPDYMVVEYDGSQLEFRVAADLGHDKVALYEIENGVDIHAATAKELTDNGDPEMVSLDPKDRRQEAKKSTFRPLYGGSAGSPALVAYCEYFKDHYKGISDTQRSWALKCADRKQFTTPYGMIFYFPKAKLQRSGYVVDTTSIYNYPVQGFATGEIIPIALVYFWHRTRDLRVRIFSTIHDSIAAKVHVDDVEISKAIAKQALTYDVYEFLKRVYKYDFKVPLGLGSKAGSHWGKGTEEKWDVWPDGRELQR